MSPVILERPKMSRPMWEALKSHILKERQRKKQELEATAEVERQRKERERQLKQDSMTLSETKEQVSSLESRLSELKEEKHQLFLQLKKVLNEDETRRRQLISKETSEMGGVPHAFYSVPSVPIPGPHVQSNHLFLQPVTLGRAQLYNPRPPPHPANLLPPGAIKRSHSPSPPPSGNSYKFGPFKPPPRQPIPYPQKPGLQYFHAPSAASQQPPISHGPVAVSYAHQPHSQGATVYAYSGPQQSSRSPQTTREEPKAHVFSHGQQLTRGYVLHPSVEHSPTAQKFADEGMKYYPPPLHHMNIRSPHLSLHSSMSIQPPQSSSGGSITSGYPMRTAPQSQPSSNFQARPSSPQVVYAGNGPPRLAYSHPHSQQPTGVSHVPSIGRYGVPPGHPTSSS